MENLLNQKDCEKIVQRFNSITSLSERLWGRMDVNQMVVHLKDQLDIALGIKAAKAQGPLLYRTMLGRWFVFYLLPYRRGKEVTPKEMDATLNGTIITDFESDKHLLLTRIKEFTMANDFSPHPFFGKISKKDWGRLAWKHINHHLLQFGA